MVYDNQHRAFLQAIMQGGAVHEQSAKTIFAQIFKGNADMSSVIRMINDKLSSIAMCLKCGTCEVTGQKYFCVVGLSHEDSVEIPSAFTKPQREFLRVIYSEIINSDDGCISSTDCLNLVNTLDIKFSASNADSFLKQITRKKWLNYQNGIYYMGVRSIIELMPYFRATYHDNFHNCHLCKDVMFHGHKCEHCDKVYHFSCISRKITDQEEDKCPNCNKNMDCSEIIEFNNTQRLNETEAFQDREGGDELMDVSDEVHFSQPVGVPKKGKRMTKAIK